MCEMAGCLIGGNGVRIVRNTNLELSVCVQYKEVIYYACDATIRISGISSFSFRSIMTALPSDKLSFFPLKLLQTEFVTCVFRKFRVVKFVYNQSLQDRQISKEKFTLEQAIKAQTESRVILHSFFNLGLLWGQVVNAKYRPLYPPGKRTGAHCTGGWVGPRACLDRCGKTCLPQGFDPRTVQSVAVRYTN